MELWVEQKLTFFSIPNPDVFALFKTVLSKRPGVAELLYKQSCDSFIHSMIR